MALITEMPVNFANVWQNIMPILFLGIMSSGVAYTLQILGQRDANPAAASIIMSLESVFGVVGAALLLGERMTPREYLGAAIVIAAVLLSQLDLDTIRKSFKK
jgi:drug/metabolite transporter (DMT)-like permease